MATISLGFNLSASAVQMASGVNAGVVELQKLGYAAKKTQQDVSTLKTLEISRAFIGGIQAIASAISQANSLLSGFVNESVSIGEEASKANVIFGDSAAAIQEFAASASGIGLSRKAALEATASFGNLFTAIGISKNEAVGYSLTLTRLATDLASFNNTSVEDAVLAISAALRGESEPIRRYGVLLSDATLKQIAFANGFETTGSSLAPSVKAQAAYYAILQQTVAAQGDFERTSAGLANQQRILAAEWNNVRAAIGDGLQPAYAAFVSGLRESLPAIQAAGQQLAAFIGQIDFAALVGSVVSTVQSLAGAFAVVVSSAAPLAGNILPLIGGYLAFINRQVIVSAVSSLSAGFIASAASAFRFAGAAGVAAVSVRALGVAIRATLASTGFGLLVVVLGALAGAAVEWSLSSENAGVAVADSFQSPISEASRFSRAVKTSISDVNTLGQKSKDALKIPALRAEDLAQDSINEAASAVKGLAAQLNGLNNVPADLLQRFRELQGLTESINSDNLAYTDSIRIASREAQLLTQDVKRLADARKRDVEAVNEALEAGRKAFEQSRQRVADLANAGLTDAEKSRLQLNKDLLDIAGQQQVAEFALAAAKRSGDAKALADARQRLKLAQQAAEEAKSQDRERQLQALGVDADLLKPAKSIAAQFKAVREAFDRKLIDGGEARQALRNLSAEGIRIRKEIAEQLSRPASEALEANDIRTSQGVSAFLAIGRQDPAIAQRREQLQKLSEIKAELRAIGARPVDILGG